MGKLAKIIFPVILVIIAGGIIHTFNDGYDGAPFMAATTGERGASLLFDTLRHMNYPVRVSRRRVNTADANRTYIFIQPDLSHFDEDTVRELLGWVAAGGHLIFLHNNPSTPIDMPVPTPGTTFGNLLIHEIGQGLFVRGQAESIVNIHLMDAPDTGARIEAILYRDSGRRIYFAEHYRRPPTADTLFNRLPVVIQLTVIQLGLLALAIVWYMGKRFGNPIPYYQAQEREENEHVHALARLYMKSKRK